MKDLCYQLDTNIDSKVVLEVVYLSNKIGNLQNLYIVSERAEIIKRDDANHDLLKIASILEE